ncbi:serine hydrolase [Massilia sp. TW-1]|uniref:Serine hydrolase n=1 Tax=Telluria antibiotica TaxID=2717319 RepID=A0ABX0PDL4_9BURK|nr:serine hydrolase [Telluria antibiotica]NIA54648.1 serine hydrolase [Telluria antibiotica]
MRIYLLSVACIAALAAGCSAPARVPRAPARAALQLDVSRFPQIDAAVKAAIAAHKLPGAVFHLEHGDAFYERAYGNVTYDADAAAVATAAVTASTVFDAASLTKVLATAPSVLMLVEQGRIGLDDKLVKYFPDCAGGGKETITIRQLLTHSSGLPAGLPATPAWHGRAAAHRLACDQAVTRAPGTFFRYSDINYVLLGQIVEQVTGTPLDDYAQAHVFAPLRMTATGYLPLRRVDAATIAPTQVGQAGGHGAHGDLAPGDVLRGVVHDPTVRRMGGVAGSAGVFTTVGDVARFARMLLDGGVLDGVRILSPESVRLLTTVQSPPGLALRGLGMDIDSPYAKRPRGTVFPIGSYGHTGFTGCVLWIDPASRAFYVLLSNRVYPDDKSNVLDLYTRLGTLAALAAGAG